MSEKKKPGRPLGARNKQTLDVKEAAQEYTEEALQKLAAIMRTGQSEAAQVAAIREILDRGHGKPKQAIEATGKDGAALPQVTIFQLPDNGRAGG